MSSAIGRRHLTAFICGARPLRKTRLRLCTVCLTARGSHLSASLSRAFQAAFHRAFAFTSTGRLEARRGVVSYTRLIERAETQEAPACAEGPGIQATPLTSGCFLVYIVSPAAPPVARPPLAAPGPLLFPPRSLILRGLATSPFLLSHRNERVEENLDRGIGLTR